MNHDETNDFELRGEPELEARLVAWVAGEASDFEQAELERIVAERPEVARFKAQLERAHALVRAATQPEAAPLRLSPERRAKLLAKLGAAETSKDTSGGTVVTMPAARAWWQRRGVRTALTLSGAAAVVAIVGLSVINNVGTLYGGRRERVVTAEVEPRLMKEARAREAAVSAAPMAQAVEVRLSGVADEVARRRALREEPKRPALAEVSHAPQAPAPGATLAAQEAPVRMDAFTVQAERDVAYAASSSMNSVNLARVFTPPKIGLEFTATASAQTATDTASGTSTMEGRSATVTNGFAEAAGAGAASTPSVASGLSLSAIQEANTLNLPTQGMIAVGNASAPAPMSSVSVSDRRVSDWGAGTIAPAAGDAYNVKVSGANSPLAVTEENKLRLASSGASLGGAGGGTSLGVGSLTEISGGIVADDLAKRGGSPDTLLAAAQTARFGSVLGKDQAALVFGSDLSAPSPATAAGYLGSIPPLQLGDRLALDAQGHAPARPDPAVATDGVLQLSAFTVSLEPRKSAPAARGRAMISLPAVTGAAPQPEPPLSVALPPITLPSGKGETMTTQEPVSTFSLHVSDVSFRLAQSTLAAMVRGENPPEPKIRAEEIYNALDYDDPIPSEREKVRARIEQSAHPILQQRNLVRIALRVAATGRVAQQPLRLTILLDTSGSMEREDRRLAVRQALSRLMALLGPQDRVTLIGFARQPRLLAENVAGGPQAADLVRLAAETPPDGGTNLEAALTLARELAVRHRTAGAQNRIVLLTDGAANLGDADPARLGTSVEALRQAGISFDACGVGLEGTGDAVLESLTRRGDGRYYVLDRAEAADAAFAAKIAGALRPAAENVKVQVRFNPARVGRYRLIGFEKHRLAAQDFRNDQVNAAELSAEEAAVAMYQVEALPEGTGDLGEVSVRFRDPATGEMVERTWTIPHEPQAPAFARATPSMQLAGFAAMLAEVLTESPVGEQVELAQLAPTANRLRTLYPQKTRVAELLTMYEQMRRLEKR